MGRFYVTTPIYYVNDVPHLGTAYTTIVADALRRFHLIIGDETFMLTGTDEHGEKIARMAAQQSKTPRQLADEILRFHDQAEIVTTAGGVAAMLAAEPRVRKVGAR